MSSIKYLVNKLILKHGTNDPFKIAKEKGIHLEFEDLEDLYGYYHYYKRVQSIHINNRNNELEQLYTCSHELGHAIQHKTQNTAYLSKHTLFSTNKLEIEANTFAVELLAPDELVYDYIQRGYNLEQIASVVGIHPQFFKLKSFD